MSWIVRLVLLAISAMISTAAGGLLAVLAFLLALVIQVAFEARGVAGDLLPSLPLAGLIGWIAIVPALKFAAIPAFALGSSLWMLGARHPWARRRIVWMVVGGGAGPALFRAGSAADLANMRDLNALAEIDPPFAIAAYLAAVVGGAAVAFIFQSIMNAARVFVDDDS